jgi:hypothetical protein
MSFDVYLRCVGRGDRTKFPFSLIEKYFEPYADHQEEYCWGLLYPDGGRCMLYVNTREAEADGFMVADPPNHPEFWRAIFELLQQTPSFLNWPNGAVIANPAVRENIWKGAIEAYGEPVLVTTGEQILEAIGKR